MSVNARSPSSTDGYIPGENFVMCAICGRRFRASEVYLQDEMWVCANDYDEYNPQDEDLHAVPEKLVPDRVGPEPESTTITYATRITADDL